MSKTYLACLDRTIHTNADEAVVMKACYSGRQARHWCMQVVGFTNKIMVTPDHKIPLPIGEVKTMFMTEPDPNTGFSSLWAHLLITDRDAVYLIDNGYYTCVSIGSLRRFDNKTDKEADLLDLVEVSLCPPGNNDKAGTFIYGLPQNQELQIFVKEPIPMYHPCTDGKRKDGGEQICKRFIRTKQNIDREIENFTDKDRLYFSEKRNHFSKRLNPNDRNKTIGQTVNSETSFVHKQYKKNMGDMFNYGRPAEFIHAVTQALDPSNTEAREIYEDEIKGAIKGRALEFANKLSQNPDLMRKWVSKYKGSDTMSVEAQRPKPVASFDINEKGFVPRTNGSFSSTTETQAQPTTTSPSHQQPSLSLSSSQQQQQQHQQQQQQQQNPQSKPMDTTSDLETQIQEKKNELKEKSLRLELKRLQDKLGEITKKEMANATDNTTSSEPSAKKTHGNPLGESESGMVDNNTVSPLSIDPSSSSSINVKERLHSAYVSGNAEEYESTLMASDPLDALNFYLSGNI